jgi:hypothetical protein
MTFQDLVARLESLGFVCLVDHFEDDGETRLLVNKPRTMTGNQIRATIYGGYHPNGYDRFGRGKEPRVELDAASLMIWFRRDRIDWWAGVTILGGRSPGTYEKTFAEPAEVYEEVLRYFFDPDSPMRLEEDFVAGPGRPPGA